MNVYNNDFVTVTPEHRPKIILNHIMIQKHVEAQTNDSEHVVEHMNP